MQLITDAEVTVVAITSIIVLLSQFAYFVEIGYPTWRDRKQSLVGNHTYATLRAFLSTYRYSFAFWVICTASEIALLIGVGILKNSNQPLAYQCLLYCKVIKETSCIFLLNTTVLFPARQLWTRGGNVLLQPSTRWRGETGEIIYYTSAVLQGIVLLVAIITSVLWLTNYEARPLLCIWAIPLPAYFAYGVLATYATLQIDSATRFPIERRIYTLTVISWTAFVVPAVVLGFALKYPLSTFHLAFYSTQCSFCGLLLAEKCLWKCWRRRHPSEEPRRLTPVSPRDYMRNPAPSVLVGRHTSHDFGYSSTTLVLTERGNSSSTSLGHIDPFELGAPQIRKEIKAEHAIFCQLEGESSSERLSKSLIRCWILGLALANGRCEFSRKFLSMHRLGLTLSRNLLEKYPSTEVVMMDINPMQPHMVPRRCTTYIDDANHPWTFRPEEFDLVHIRGLAGCIEDWPALFRQVFGSLREGGYVEFCDTTLPKKTSENDEWLQPVNLEKPWAAHLALRIRKFVDSTWNKPALRYANLGPSTTSKKGIGQDVLNATIKKLQGVNEFRLSKLGWAEEEINRQSEKMQRELEDPDVWPYIEVVRVIGQKPGKEELQEAEADSLGVGSVLDGNGTHHTRVYGGGVCSTYTSAGRDHGEGR
ncbi:unnamed protein product [Clonostachys solani]|uniref:Uncharacterized protein n=1 Tax=Clonostachys solani TaxID=160281 RepID=A0A9N9ZG59_9HYPO|nr:unnamed protein product [Clonostachys solani]